MLPPPMNRVIKVANKFLNQDIYQPHDTNLRGQSAKSQRQSRCTTNSNEETSEDSSSESSSSSSDKEEVAKTKSKGKKWDSSTKEENATSLIPMSNQTLMI